jgi:hypothetical protein
MAAVIGGEWTVKAGTDIASGAVRATFLEWGVPNILRLDVKFENLPSGFQLDVIAKTGRADFKTRIHGGDRTIEGTHYIRDADDSVVTVELVLPGFTREWIGTISCPVHDANGKGNTTVFAKECKLEVIAKSEPTPMAAAFAKTAIVLRNPGRLDYSRIINLSHETTTHHEFVSQRHYYEPALAGQGWHVVLEELGKKRDELDPYVLPVPEVTVIGEGDGGIFSVGPVLPMRDFTLRFYPTRNGETSGVFYAVRATSKPLLGE